MHHKPRIDPLDAIANDFDAVACNLRSSLGQKLCRRHAFAGKETLHVRGWSVPGFVCVDDGDPTSGSPEHEGGAQSCWAAANDHYVVLLLFHWILFSSERSAAAGVDGGAGERWVVDQAADFLKPLNGQGHAE